MTPSAASRPIHKAAATWLRLPASLLVAAGLRLGLLAAGVVPFNSDEAVVGLMARHILQGERPIFCYGVAYMGSLDAWLVAALFWLFGQSVTAIRLVQIALFLGTIATTYLLGLQIYRSHWIAGAAGLLLAVPPVLFTLYSTVSLGDYGETLLIGNLCLLLAIHVLSSDSTSLTSRASVRRGADWLLLGLLGGLGFWAFPMILVFVVPILAAALVVYRRRIAWLALTALLYAAGFGAGALPWFAYAVQNRGNALLDTSGQAIAWAAGANLLFVTAQHAFNFLLFGLTVIWGLRPPWSAAFLAIALAPFAIALNSGVVLFAARQSIRRRDQATLGRWLLAGVAVTLVLAFVLTPWGADPSGRYFLPLGVPMALFTAEMLHWLRLRRRTRRSPWRKWFGQSLALGLVAFSWWGNVQSAVKFPPGLTTQLAVSAQIDQRALPDLAVFLQAQGETRGYTTYWVEYPLAFASQDRLIFVARLPYHDDFQLSPRDDRYAPYDEEVAAAPRVAYITARLPLLDDRLRHTLDQLAVTYRETTIGDFHVYYGLSRRVSPDELGLDP